MLAESPGSHNYLLDLDRELAEELDIHMRPAARQSVTAVTFDADAGQLGLSDWLALADRGPGLLILDGVVAAHVQVRDRMSAELLGSGDLIQPWTEDEAELVCKPTWRVLVSARFALLDAAFAQRVERWPQVTASLLRRAGERARRLNVQRAIAAQPRLEVRLVLLMWHLAARWGKPQPRGIRLPLPLTHDLLGRLIGAERPSVSHSLTRLAHAGLLTGRGGMWHLHGSVDEHLAIVSEPTDARVHELSAQAAPSGLP